MTGALSAGFLEGRGVIGENIASKPKTSGFESGMKGYLGQSGRDYFAGADTAAAIEIRFKELLKEHHPNIGGNAGIMAEIAIQRAMKKGYSDGQKEARKALEAREAGTGQGLPAVIPLSAPGQGTAANTPAILPQPAAGPAVSVPNPQQGGLRNQAGGGIVGSETRERETPDRVIDQALDRRDLKPEDETALRMIQEVLEPTERTFQRYRGSGRELGPEEKTVIEMERDRLLAQAKSLGQTQY
jgi:hypothetical protein